jgi:hypothetical protein
MFGFGIHKVQASTMATGASTSGSFDIRNANAIGIEIPAFGTVMGSATVNVYVAVAASAGTFVRLKAMGTYSSTSGIQDWEIPQGSGGYIANCPVAVGFTQMQIQFPTTVTGTGGPFTPRVHVMQ